MRPQVKVSILPVLGRSYNCWGIGLTCVRPAVRPLAPSYLRLTGLPCWVDHVGGPVVLVRGQLVVGPGRVADLSLSEHQVARLDVSGAYSTVVDFGDSSSIGQCSEMGVSSFFLQ
ncbi:hypothetical protein BHE74_00023947 [Ensete ventricosum]|nr:hypothetical protein BHE74_00023947 [Ensete ventricosum]